MKRRIVVRIIGLVCMGILALIKDKPSVFAFIHIHEASLMEAASSNRSSLTANYPQNANSNPCIVSVDNICSKEQPINVFLPLVSRHLVESPFWVQIAALHQISPGEITNLQIMSRNEWRSLLEEAFPTLIDALLEIGVSGTRIYLKWSDIEPNAPVNGQPPQYNWTWYDDRLRQIGEAGLHLIVTIADIPAWAADSPCSPIYPDRLDEFARFLNDLVNRYRKFPFNVRYWEIVNEPDYTWSNGWVGGLGCYGFTSSEYSDMLSVAYPAIKNADPHASVLMGGVAHDWFTEYGGPFNRYFPDQLMEAGGDLYFDIANFHYFPDFHREWERWDPDSPERRNGLLPAPTCGDLFDGEGVSYEAGGKDLIAKASHFRNRMQTCFGLEKPVWVTELAEHGYADNPDSLSQQARYVIQGYVRGLATGVSKIVWFALATPNHSHEQSLLFDDWTPKPAFFAYKTLTSEMAGYQYQYTLNVPDVEGYAFIAPNNSEKIVAWGGGTLIFAPASQLRIIDRQGNLTWVADGGTGDVDGAKNDSVKLQITADPVFVQIHSK